MINATEFANKFAKKFNISKDYANTVIKSVFSFLGETLYENKEDVMITRFGSFTHVTTAEKKVRHPKTGEIITIEPKDVVKFRQTSTAEDKTE